MSNSVKVTKPWQARDVDNTMLVVLAANIVGALVLGQIHGQLGLASTGGAAAAVIALAGYVFARGTLTSSLTVSAALMGVIALQIQLTGGNLLYHFNIFVSLSLLLAYRDWRPIAFMATLFVAHHVAFDRLLQAGFGTFCLSQPDLTQVALHVSFVGVQAAFLGRVANMQLQAAREARELEFLVNAMGREGKIRLNLDVVRAQTPVGQRLQHVQQRMAAAVSEMHAASQQIESAASQVSEGSHELTSRSESTAHGLKEAAMCLDQIGIIVQDSTEASNEAKTVSTTAASMATQGDRMVSDVVKTMQEIETSSRRITEIIAVIDGIAFQTNILALNAAVEAARAGEQGRGFAVVAGEVRQLAQRSAGAAKEIRSLITHSAETVQTGTRMVSTTGETMNKLVGSVKRVGELFESVTANTTEHIQGLQTVTQSISALSDVTQQNVSVAERADIAAGNLKAQAERLAEVLQAFNLGGATLMAATAPPVAATRPAPTAAPVEPRTKPTAPPPAQRTSAEATVEFF